MSEQNIIDLTAIAYLIAGVLFILALRGLSSPESSRVMRLGYEELLSWVWALITSMPRSLSPATAYVMMYFL